jgi:hypothetical protein
MLNLVLVVSIANLLFYTIGNANLEFTVILLRSFLNVGEVP